MNDAHTQRMLQTIGFDRIVHSEPTGVARVRFDARPEFAPSQGTTVQGGLIAAWLDNEPLPLPRSVAEACHPNRFAQRALVRSSPPVR